MSDSTTRRRLLYGTTIAVGAALAGCTDGQQGDGQDGQAGEDDGLEQGDDDPDGPGGDETGGGAGNETGGAAGNETGAGGNETGGATGNQTEGGAAGGQVPQEIDQFLSDANEYDGSVEDMTGQDEVTVEVGGGQNGLAFVPPAVRVDAGSTVVWEWTGEGGAHNVASTPDSDADFRSGDPVDDPEATFEQTFDQAGSMLYVCEPHEAAGMLGAIEVAESSGG